MRDFVVVSGEFEVEVETGVCLLCAPGEAKKWSLVGANITWPLVLSCIRNARQRYRHEKRCELAFKQVTATWILHISQVFD